MDSFVALLKGEFGENRIRTHEPMSLHSALKVGGPAASYIEVDRTEELVKSVALAGKENIPFIVVGSGSKTIFPDEGYSGLVIKNNSRKFDVLSRKGKIRNNRIDVDRAYIFADSGAILNQVVRFTIEQGYQGIEEALGVSGSVGGALYARDAFSILSPVLYQIQAVSYHGDVKMVTGHDLLYSDSLGVAHKGRYAALTVVFELFPGVTASLWEKATKSIEKRNHEKPSATSSYRAFSDITISEAMSIPTPKYTQSVSYLLEKAGLPGKQIGNVMVSEQFPNYIINLGNASGNDMIALLEFCRDIVRKKFGVRIRPEFTIVGK